MPISLADLQPFLQSGQMYSSPFITSGNPVVKNAGSSIPKSGGYGTTDEDNGSFIPGLPGFVTGRDNGFMDFLDPTGMLGGLFGGKDEKDPEWQPYQKDGMYYWTDPAKSNPVPVTDIPGANQKPNRVYKQTANEVRALDTFLPYYQDIVNKAALPAALTNYNVAEATSGPYAQLMTRLYNTYGPQLNAIGNEISRRNALAQAGTDLEVVKGPGRELVGEALNTAKMYDPEYFATRSRTADELGRLFSSIDLSGALSPTERDEIGKGLARQNLQAGTMFSPSQTNTVANAIQYGNAGYQRKTQQQGILSDAISKSSQFLPAAKSGTDVFQVATGKSSMPNTGNNLFTGINNKDSNGGAALGTQMFGGMNSLQMNNDNNNTAVRTTQMQIDAQKKDWLDKMSQITSSIGSIAGMAGGMI